MKAQLDTGTLEADQYHTVDWELSGTENQVFESPGSDQTSSGSSGIAVMTSCVAEKACCRRPQSRIFEMYGGGFHSELEASHIPHEMYDTSTTSTKGQTSAALEGRSSPELRHPIYCESDRDSLWQRMRGMPAANRRRSSAKHCRKDWPVIDDKEKAISSSSWGPSEPNGSPHSVPDDGDAKLLGGSSSKNQICPNVSSDAHQCRMSAHPMSVSDVKFPRSPDFGHYSSPSNILSPVSPMTKYVCPPLTIVPSDTVTCDDLSSGTIEHDEEFGGGWITLGSSPLESTSKESNTTCSGFNVPETHLSTQLPVLHVMESLASNAQETERSMDQQSLRPAHLQGHFQDLDAQSVSRRLDHLRPRESRSQGSIHPNRLDKSPHSETSLSIVQSVGTQVDTSRSEEFAFLPFISPSKSPSLDTDMDSTFQFKYDNLPPSESILPAIAFQVPSFSQTSDSRTSVVAEPINEKMDMSDSDTWEMSLHPSRQAASIAYSSFNLINKAGYNIKLAGNAEVEEGLQGKLEDDVMITQEQEIDKLIAIITSGLDSASPDNWPSDIHRRPETQRHSCDFATSQALSPETMPHRFNCSLLSVSHSASKQVHVEELLALFRIVNIEWMQRLECLPDLQRRCKNMLQSDLFERAIRTLKDFTRGRFAQTFEDVFAVMHLALAAAFYLRCESKFYSWRDFCVDALEWQHALPSPIDKISFSNAMKLWGYPEREPTPLFYSSSYTGFGSITPQGSIRCGDQSTLLDTLRDSQVFKVCIGLLDCKFIRSQFATEIATYKDRSN